VNPLPSADRRIVLLAAAACSVPLWLQLAPVSTLLAVLVLAISPLVARTPPVLLRLFLIGALGLSVLVVHFPGIGRDGASALLAAMLALKALESFDRRNAYSLLGFSMFAPFAAFLQDQGPFTLLLGVPAVLFLLLAIARLTPRSDAPAPALRQEFGGALRIALLALPLALVGFWLFPRLSSPLWGMPNNAIARTGLGDEMSPGSWLDLFADDSPAARALFIGPEPRERELYWRGPVLNVFDGTSWRRTGMMQGLPPAEVRPGPAPWRYRLEIEPTERRNLITLDLPLSAPEGSRLGHDHTAVSNQPLHNLRRYTLESAPPLQYEADLPETLRRAALDLPDEFNPRTLELARQWRAETDDDVAIVNRALDWIRRDFSYSLDAPLLGRHSVDEFLFGTRVGYCEHFSSAFTVLMRGAGIPARVVTGYAGGYRNPFGGFWLIRHSDAHAWSEVWLHGRGWVRVDPTAAVAPERVFETVEDLRDAGPLSGLTPAFDLNDWAVSAWNDFVLGYDALRQEGLLRPFGIEQADRTQLGIALAVATAITLLLTLQWMRRGERRAPLDPLERAWRRFLRRLRRDGLEKRPNETALAFASRLTGQPAAAGLCRAYSDARYARQGGEDTEALVRALRGYTA
jgi:transglutaminase-like putative cysteine protease